MNICVMDYLKLYIPEKGIINIIRNEYLKGENQFNILYNNTIISTRADYKVRIEFDHEKYYLQFEFKSKFLYGKITRGDFWKYKKKFIKRLIKLSFCQILNINEDSEFIFKNVIAKYAIATNQLMHIKTEMVRCLRVFYSEEEREMIKNYIYYDKDI